MVVEPVQSYWKDTTCCSATIVDQKKVAPICQHDRVCPSGWTLFNSYCYLLVPASANATWANAEQDCYSKGGHLASVHSTEENTFLINLATTALWIGASDAAVEVRTHMLTL
jgi:hypothetical protein